MAPARTKESGGRSRLKPPLPPLVFGTKSAKRGEQSTVAQGEADAPVAAAQSAPTVAAEVAESSFNSPRPATPVSARSSPTPRGIAPTPPLVPRKASRPARSARGIRPSSRQGGDDTGTAGAGTGPVSPKAGSFRDERWAAFAASRSKSEEQLCRQLFELADGEAHGRMRFGDFAWLHTNLLSFAGPMNIANAGLLHTFGWHFPQQAFRRLDADSSRTLEPCEWSQYSDGMLRVFGKRTLADAYSNLRKQATRRYEDGTSRRLLDKVAHAQHLGSEHTEQAQSLLHRQADPNCQDANGRTVLSHAAAKADLTFLATLLSRGANAACGGRSFESPVLTAARARQLESLHLLLFGHPRQVDHSRLAEEKVATTLLEGMAELSEKTLWDAVAKEGVDINFRNSQGWTLLTTAAFWGRQECVECLVRLPTIMPKLRLDANARNAKQRTALHIAAQKGRDDLIPTLLRGRADVNVVDGDGWTPLHHAVFSGHSAVVHILVPNGADLAVKDARGFTALMLSQSPAASNLPLSKDATALLQPPDTITFSKRVLPILKDDSLTPYGKIEELLGLWSGGGGLVQLRLYDQAFHPRRGPNKALLCKIWQLLAKDMLGRLKSGRTELEDVVPTCGEEGVHEEEMRLRRRLQRRFVAEWLEETSGPPASADWNWANREGYQDELKALVKEELASFKDLCDYATDAALEKPGGDALCHLPCEKVPVPRRTSQRDVHMSLAWLDNADAIGAFEALRRVGALGSRADSDNEAAVVGFVDLLGSHPDLSTGPDFWRNVYKLWLAAYARLADIGFQATMRKAAVAFNEEHVALGLEVTFRGEPPKTYEQLKQEEVHLGYVGHETAIERRVAGGLLDVVRGYVIANGPAATVAFVQFFQRAARTRRTNKLELVRLRNGFSEDAAPPHGLRCVTLSLLYRTNERSGEKGCNDLPISIIGEVSVFLPEFAEIKESMQPLLACMAEEGANASL